METKKNKLPNLADVIVSGLPKPTPAKAAKPKADKQVKTSKNSKSKS
jgi:hypothetical protein